MAVWSNVRQHKIRKKPALVGYKWKNESFRYFEMAEHNDSKDKLSDVVSEIQAFFPKKNITILNEGKECGFESCKIAIQGVTIKALFEYVLSTYNHRPYTIGLSLDSKNPYKGFVYLAMNNKFIRFGVDENGVRFFSECIKKMGFEQWYRYLIQYKMYKYVKIKDAVYIIQSLEDLVG